MIVAFAFAVFATTGNQGIRAVGSFACFGVMTHVLNARMQLRNTDVFRVEMRGEHLRFEVVFREAYAFHIQGLLDALFAHVAIAGYLEGDDSFLIAGESHADDGKEQYQHFADVFHVVGYYD